jgi:membrane-associated phospholipid phosphatase
MYSSARTLLALPDLTATPPGELLAVIVALAVVVLISRIVLSFAWKILLVAGLVVGALYVLDVGL